MSMSKVEDIINRAERKVRAAYYCLELYKQSEGDDKYLWLCNSVESAREVTWVLQKLRGQVDEFDEWYEGMKEVLVEDPICKNMISIRNRMVKEGKEEARPFTYISEVTSSDLPDKPEWADSYFFDGRFGYLIEREGKEDIRVYDNLDIEGIERGMLFEAIYDPSDIVSGDINKVEEDLEYYILVMVQLVLNARSEFLE